MLTKALDQIQRKTWWFDKAVPEPKKKKPKVSEFSTKTLVDGNKERAKKVQHVFRDAMNGEECTAKEIAERLNRHVDAVHKYMTNLRRLGLIEKAGTKPSGGQKPFTTWKWIGD